jgi:hypothetical protein
MRYQFDAELWQHSGPAAWYFVTIPADIADEIAELTAGDRRGFGSVRVTATAGRTAWNTSIFPDSASQSYVLPVKRQVRDREALDAGHSVHLTLELARHNDTT